MFRPREIQRAIHRVVGPAQLVQRRDQSFASAQRDRNKIGLEFHLSGQSALRQDYACQKRVRERSKRPHHELQNPTHPGNSQVEPAQTAQERIECVALVHDLGCDLLGDVDPASHRHRFLGKVAELMRKHGFELAQRQNIDQPEPDLQVFSGREEQIEERQIVEYGRVHARRQEYAMRLRRARLIGDRVEKLEQTRMVRTLEFEILGGCAPLDEDKPLGHE
jgi:hypothetical protein